jgi:uncharacterized protein YjiS (DUF1127 family)
MPQKFDIDRYLREFHTLTPAQRNAAVRVVMREAKQVRAQAFRDLFRGFGRWSWSAMVWGSGGVRRLGAAAWRRYSERRRRRLAAARLYAMDDRMLKDIGLRRGEIDFVVSGAQDPTRIPRSPNVARDPLAAFRPKPGKQPVQRAEAPLVLRNSCAG